MMRSRSAPYGRLALVLSALLACGPALADKPDGVGGGRPGGKQEQHQKQDKGAAREDREQGNREAREQRQIREERDVRDDRYDRDDRRVRDDRSYRDDRGETVREHRYFEDRQRASIRNYYTQEYRRGHCPPGLAKKRNGCMPPGLTKRWHVGHPLPRDVIYYDLPPALVLELGPPPARHRYVRVGADILMIAIGTGLVIDALEDLSRM